MRIKGHVRSFYEFLRPHWRTPLLILGALVLTSQVAILGSFCVKNQDQKAVIYAQDNDASRAIQTVQKSRWWNSNHFAPYGPLYYRLAHTIAVFTPYEGPDSYSPEIASERNHHLALQLASLFALVAWAFLISSILLQETWQRLLLTPLFVAILTDNYWANMVIRPHPDLLFALTTGLATWATARWIFEDEREDLFKWMGLAWGVAFGTKMTLILFIPAYALLFFPWKKAHLIKALQMVGWMLLGYTLIGFPQSLSYGKVLKFLLGESAVTMPANAESVQKWIDLFVSEILPAIVLVFGVSLVSSRLPARVEKKKILRLLAFCILPCLILLTRRQAYSIGHFTLPFFSCLIIGVAYILRRMFPVHLYPVFLVAYLMIPTVPKAYDEYLREAQVCRQEAREMNKLLEDLQKKNQLVAHDPYVPTSTHYPKFSKQIWGMRWGDIEAVKPQAIALNSKFYNRYLAAPAEHLWQKEVDEWPTRAEFYQAFHDQIEVKAPNGTLWKKTYTNDCGMELWEVSGQ